MSRAKDEFFFGKLEAIATEAAACSASIVEAARSKRPLDIGALAEAHDRSREAASAVRSELVETWLLPIDRDDVRELAAVLVRIVEQGRAIGVQMERATLDPTVVELADVFARGCASAAASTVLLSKLRGNRDAIARALSEEQRAIEVGRKTFASALRKSFDETLLEREGQAATRLLAIVATRELLERQRRGLDALLAHAILVESLLLEYA